MSQPPRPSWALCLYYGFLLLTTALSHGVPYPLFGAVLTGPVATGVRTVDCLLLIHIVLGVARAQRLTWYLIVGYNGFNLVSLMVTLAVLTPAQLSTLLGGEQPDSGFYLAVSLSVLAVLVATAYAIRARRTFSNPSLFLF